MKRPLSNAAEILRLMRNGWELGYSDAGRSDGRYWIQKGGLCRGGESCNVHASTMHSMVKNGLIKNATKASDRFWLRRYKANE